MPRQKGLLPQTLLFIKVSGDACPRGAGWVDEKPCVLRGRSKTRDEGAEKERAEEVRAAVAESGKRKMERCGQTKKEIERRISAEFGGV